MRRESKYKSEIIKKRKKTLLGELENALDEMKQAIGISAEESKQNAESIIKASPVYAEINRLCTEVIPLYEDFSLKGMDFDASVESLYYSYASNAEWNQVKTFYREWFAKQGWQLTEERDEYAHFAQIAGITENYKITLYDATPLDAYLLSGRKIRMS
ncbi:MAG: hypothetical protein M3384_01820 [Acidobacteriota bacterium]|nr:hypothetical protein [Acidobacteriota bacterium]